MVPGKSDFDMKDQAICIVGPRNLQNELLASFLTGATHATCSQTTCLEEIPPLGEKLSIRPRLILWEFQASDCDACCSWLEKTGPGRSGKDLVALFNMHPEAGKEERFLKLGVRGFFYLHDSSSLLLKGVKHILDGELWVSREILNKVVLDGKWSESSGEKPPHPLTNREIEILLMLSAGSKNEEIADKFCISPNTVKTHVYNIFKKINVPNRLQAALWALKNL
jgi:LuxR family transcriptional regulator of csgAB operon